MRTTIFSTDGERITYSTMEEPRWEPFEEYDGKPLSRVNLFEILEARHGELQMVQIGAGGHFAMHTSPDLAFCQVVRGRGKLGLPDGTALEYEAPELYVFLPGSLHDWHDVEEDTLLSVCLIKQSTRPSG